MRSGCNEFLANAKSMTLNDIWSPVNSGELRVLIPESVLNDVVQPFENLMALSVRIFTPDGGLYYGPEGDNRLPVVEVPIIVDHHEIGTLGIFDVADEPRARQAADYLANSLSIIATELFRRRAIGDEVLDRYDELNVIYDLAALISSNTLTHDELVQHVLSEANRILRAEAGAIYVYDDAREELEPLHFFGRVGVEFWAGRTRELALSALYAYDSAQLFENGRMICAPLRHNQQRLGALVLVHQSMERAFNANDVKLLTTLSQNTTLFLQAARLIDALAQRNQELEDTLEELQATRDELSRSERLSIIGQTVGGLVHDMRKPLSNVMGYAGLLQETDLTHEERYEYANQIIGFINTFSAMAQEILDYTHGDDEQIDRTRVDVSSYMQFIEDRLKPPGLQLPVEVIVDTSAAHGYAMYVDRQRFMRVFQNLVNNAIDAIEDHSGSRVIVRAEPAPNNMIQFAVSDDGPGVPPDKVNTIFEPLITTKAHGTGLGLAIVRRMIIIHGGDIHYEPASEGGASFIFTVPIAN